MDMGRYTMTAVPDWSGSRLGGLVVRPALVSLVAYLVYLFLY